MIEKGGMNIIKYKVNKKLIITGSLAIVLGVLMVFIFFYEQPKIDKEFEGKQLFETEEVMDILELSFNPRESERFTISGAQNGQLSLVDPYFYRLSNTSVDSMFEDLNKIVISEFVEMDVKELSRYGLENPAMQLGISYKDGTKSVLDIGNVSFDGSKRYIKKGDTLDVGYVDMKLIDRFFVTLSDVRDKHMMRLNANKIDNIAYKNADNEVFLVKNGGVWTFEESTEDVIDNSIVNAWINKTMNITADSVYGYVESTDVNQEDPIGNVSIILADGSEHKLISYQSTDETNYYIVPYYLSGSDESDESLRPESFVYQIDKRVFDSIFDPRDKFVVDKKTEDSNESEDSEQ